MAQIRVDCIDEAYRKSKNAWLDIIYHERYDADDRACLICATTQPSRGFDARRATNADARRSVPPTISSNPDVQVSSNSSRNVSVASDASNVSSPLVTARNSIASCDKPAPSQSCNKLWRSYASRFALVRVSARNSRRSASERPAAAFVIASDQ